MSTIIAIDAGHGMGTAGKRCLKSIDANQTREWWLNDRIADRLEQLLADYDCRVIRVDDTTGAKDVSLAARVRTANNADADVYMSVHHNAGIKGGKGGGSVVYHYSKTATQAQALYDAVVGSTGLRGNRSQKVVKKGYYVLTGTRMPAFLIENGFMDSATDTPIILTEEHAEKTAQGILKFLVAQYNLKKKSEEAGSTGTYYLAYKGPKTTLSAAMKSLGINNTYTFRAKIAAQNNINGYRGTYSQNTQMYNMLVAGLLKKV